MRTLLDYTDGGSEGGDAQRPLVRTPARVQSPSSILTYKQCPRKYFYRYIKRLPSKKSIHLVRGSIVHQVLEDFYKKDLSVVPDTSFPVTVRVILQEMFAKEWAKSKTELDSLGLGEFELEEYFEETRTMINNFFHYLLDKLKAYDIPLGEALNRIKPRTEIKLESREHHVMGYADAVHEHDGKTYILDYKTSKKAEITEDYYLQLSIYGLIFEEIDKLPDEVGIFFLKHGQELRLPLTKDMVELAKSEVHDVHRRVHSKHQEDYPKKLSPLCNWGRGQCDYFEQCFGQISHAEFKTKLFQIGRSR